MRVSPRVPISIKRVGLDDGRTISVYEGDDIPGRWRAAEKGEPIEKLVWCAGETYIGPDNPVWPDPGDVVREVDVGAWFEPVGFGERVEPVEPVETPPDDPEMAPESYATRPTSPNPPAYYNRGGVHVWDVVRAWDLDHWRATALKYLCRAGHKPGADAQDDMRKAIDYLREGVIDAGAGSP